MYVMEVFTHLEKAEFRKETGPGRRRRKIMNAAWNVLNLFSPQGIQINIPTEGCLNGSGVQERHSG